MTYKIRNRSGNVIINTDDLRKVTHFLNASSEEVTKAIEKRLTIHNRYTVEGISDKKDTDILEQQTSDMVDKGYGVDYGRYQVDKTRGKL